LEAVSDGERLTEVRPWRGEPEPMPLTGNLASAQHHLARITPPYVRKGQLDRVPGAPGRGGEPFAPLSWLAGARPPPTARRRIRRASGCQ
jgi:biotin/methionine sulfoxide reductase